MILRLSKKCVSPIVPLSQTRLLRQTKGAFDRTTNRLDDPSLKDILGLRLSTLKVIKSDSITTKAKIQENKRKIKWLERCRVRNRRSTRALIAQIQSLSHKIKPEDLVDFKDEMKELEWVSSDTDGDEDVEMEPDARAISRR